MKCTILLHIMKPMQVLKVFLAYDQCHENDWQYFKEENCDDKEIK